NLDTSVLGGILTPRGTARCTVASRAHARERQGLDGEKQYARAPLPPGRTGAGGSGASAYRPPPWSPLHRTRIDARRAHRTACVRALLAFARSFRAFFVGLDAASSMRVSALVNFRVTLAGMA